MFFAVLSPGEGRSKPVPKTRNGWFHNGPVHNLLMQFFTVGSSKIKVFKTHFF